MISFHDPMGIMTMEVVESASEEACTDPVFEFVFGV